MCQNRVCFGRLLALRLRRLPRFPRRLGGGTARRPGRFCRLCSIAARYVPFLPICAVLRRTVQNFAVIVPYNAVLCPPKKPVLSW